MFAQRTAVTVRSAMLALGLIVLAGSAQAQQPSAAAVSMAKELIALKGATGMYDPVLRGVVEQAKIVLLRTNPMLSKELTEVTAKLHAEYAAQAPGAAGYLGSRLCRTVQRAGAQGRARPSTRRRSARS